MLKTIFKTTVLAAAFAAGAFIAGGHTATLSGDALRSAIADKTVFLKISGFELPIQYSSRGTMKGRMSSFAAAFSGSEGVSDRGKWWVDGSRLCQKWSSWMDGETYCYTLSRSGDRVRWVRSDGRSGTARIAG